jgi:hypothetical protein
MDTETMILKGEGYALTITPEAQLQKERILRESSQVTVVSSNDESADAAFEMRKLAKMRILVEKSRKEIKEPVVRIGKEIDQAAAEFLLEIDAEENRIRKLIGDHATEVLKLKQEAEERERLAFEAEMTARAIAESGGIAAVLEARDALQDKLKASEEVATTKIAQGVRFVWDFEVTSIDDLMRFAPDLVKVEPKRREILLWLKGLEENEDRDAAAIAAQVGIVAYKIPSISTR